MIAFGVTKYGPISTIHQLDLPTPEPGAGQVRVRVMASAINPADFKVIEGKMKFLHGRRMPLVVGYDFSGVIDAVGSGVEGFHKGEEVFGFLPYAPTNNRGAFAAFVVASTKEIAKKPAKISHLTAATAATTGLTTMQALRDLGKVPRGGRVLVTGASGGVGSIAVGIALKLGAEVTAVGTGWGLETARRLGAKEVIERSELGSLGEAQFDVVFDAAAAYRVKNFRRYRGAG